LPRWCGRVVAAVLARVLDGLFSAGFLCYAAYLVVASPATVTVFYYAFAAPIWAVVHVRRAHKGVRATGSVPSAIPSSGYGSGFGPVGAQPPPSTEDPCSGTRQAEQTHFAPYSSYQHLPSGLTNAPRLTPAVPWVDEQATHSLTVPQPSTSGRRAAYGA